MTEKPTSCRVTIAGRAFTLRSDEVERALESVEPDPIKRHYVVVGGRRFAPKQVIGELTGLDRADFTTHQARRTLMRLGFSAGRRPARGAPTQTGSSAPTNVAGAESLASRLRGYRGRWVAIQDDDLLVARDSPHELVEWLARHGQKADSMFRVPDSELAGTGLAPL